MCDVSFTEIEHRRVARALYWHVENRTSLINLMAATFSEAASRDKERAHGWRNKLLVLARALRRAMLIHRDSRDFFGGIGRTISRICLSEPNPVVRDSYRRRHERSSVAYSPGH
jgi:hypothetical protein